MGVRYCRALLGLLGVLLVAACGADATGGATALRPAGQVTLENFAIEVIAKNETSLSEVSYELNGITKTVAGTAVDESVFFDFDTIDSGNHTLKSTFGNLAFTLNDDGTMTVPSFVPMTASGTTLTIDNRGGFPTLAVDALENTSVAEVGYRLDAFLNTSLPADRTIGTEKTIAGTAAKTGVTFPFQGMTPGQVFRLRTSFGTIQFRLKSDNTLQARNPNTDGKLMKAAGATITIQNNLGFDPLEIVAKSNTSLTEVTYELTTIENRNFLAADNSIGSQVTLLGGAVKTGLPYPFQGMAPLQDFRLKTTLGDIAFGLDENGDMVAVADDRSPERMSASGSTLTIENTISHVLTVTADDPADQEAVLYALKSDKNTGLPADRIVDGRREISGGEVTNGVQFSMEGMTHKLSFRLFTNFATATGQAPEAPFEFFLDGTADFKTPTVQLSDTKATLTFDLPPATPGEPADPPTNTLTLELSTPVNHPPVVDAGPNLKIHSSQQAASVLHGTATDEDGDELTCRWLHGGQVVAGPTVVTGGKCDLALATLDPLGAGDHEFTLAVSDGQVEVEDTVILTVDNSPPQAIGSGAGVYRLTDRIVLTGTVSDFDSDVVTWVWRRAGEGLVATRTLAVPGAGRPVDVEKIEIPATDLGLGVHTLSLVVDDGVNDEVTDDIVVEIMDASVPVLWPVIEPRILWTADDTLRYLTLHANAWDSSGRRIEPQVEFRLADGAAVPAADLKITRFEAASGTMQLQLRATPTEGGTPRTYEVSVSAKDGDGNTSVAVVKVEVNRKFQAVPAGE